MAAKINLQFQDQVSDTESIQEEDETSLKIKKLLRKSNWNYLNKHPEIRAIIRVLLHQWLNTMPKNVYEAAAQLFDSAKLDDLIKMINLHLDRINAELKRNTYNETDAKDFFDRTNDAVCDYSRCLLEYALVGDDQDLCKHHETDDGECMENCPIHASKSGAKYLKPCADPLKPNPPQNE